MKASRNPRIAWLIPFVPLGHYWPPILEAFLRIFPRTKVFSCIPSGYPWVYFVGRVRRFIVRNQDRSCRWAIILLPLMRMVVRLAFLRPKIVFVGGFNLWTAVSVLMKPLLKFRLVTVFDGSSPAADGRGKKALIRYRTWIARQSDALITNSREGAAYLSRFLSVAGDKIFSSPYLVPSAFVLDRDGGPPDLHGLTRPIFLFVGRVSHLKGMGTLLEACAELLRRGHSAFGLMVIGGGYERKNYHELARRLNVEKMVRWEGRVAYGRLAAYYRACDVLVFPTLTDVWGMAALEAMIFSKPVISSRAAGVSDLITDGVNGFLMDPEKPRALADIMEKFIMDPALARRLGEKLSDLHKRMNPVSAAESLSNVVRYVQHPGHTGGNI